MSELALTLDQLLSLLSNLDQDQAIEFEPDQVIGDLREKVDAIRTVQQRLRMEEERLRENAAELTRAAQAVKSNRERLDSYVVYAMQSNGFDKVPGKYWRMQKQRTAPSVITDHEPGPDDALRFGEFVERQVTYKWNKPLIKGALESGSPLDFAALKENTTVRFYALKENS